LDHEIPEDLHYSADDEWVRVEGGVFVGVTDYAQHQLGDIVYVELPKRGDSVVQGDAFGVIESVKAVIDLRAPISGEIISVNELLADQPELVNGDCYGDGWMIEVSPSDETEVGSLMDATAYAASVAERDT
jgi:glycine cleavage system H protein